MGRYKDYSPQRGRPSRVGQVPDLPFTALGVVAGQVGDLPYAAWLLALFCAFASAQVVDRIAVVVGNNVITESEVLQELRLTEFLNGQPPDLGPEQRRAAAERLVDQQLIRDERSIGHYPEPSINEAEAALRSFRQERYKSDADFQTALQLYGITEEQLKQHLLWQIAAIRFTDMRFRLSAPAPATQSADRVQAGTAADKAAPSDNAIEEQMDAWLKETRAATRVVFKKEAFQ